jgi:hypothetical protein
MGCPAGLNVDHLRVIHAVFDGLELASNRLELLALLGLQEVLAQGGTSILIQQNPVFLVDFIISNCCWTAG